MRPGPATSTPRCCRCSERVLGAEHPDTLAARANLAHWTGQAGDAAGARDQYAALLPVQERVLGRRAPGHADHPRQPRPLDRARRGMRPGPATSTPRCCPYRSGCSGAEHPDTLGTRANLATCTGRAGDAAGARDQYAALLPVFERVLGAEHPVTLNARANLAYRTKRAGGDTGPGVD